MNNIIKKSFKQDNKKVSDLLTHIQNITKEHKIEDFDCNLTNLYIATSHINKLSIYNNFLTVDEIIRCCTSSSFIPFLTYKDLMYIYKNKICFDGGFYYKKYIKSLTSQNYNTLIISFKMFGRFKNERISKELFRKKVPSSYQLYINDYHDALKNHKYFEKYLI